jgi:branched-chain amino acid transport system ATP-binding protein
MPAEPEDFVTGQSVIRTGNLSVGYGSVAVVTQLNLQVGAGEIVALLGPNGAGKTTTLLTLAGVLTPIEGTIDFLEKPLRGPLHVRAKRGMMLVTEERAIIRRLTVRENIRLAGVDSASVFGVFPELDRLARRRAGLLSGGEQQMLALGRAIAAMPKLLLVDELSFGLAPLVVERLTQALRHAADKGAAVLLVEQHAALALASSDRGYVLARGQIQLTGNSPELLGRFDEIEQSYLTDAPLLG